MNNTSIHFAKIPPAKRWKKFWKTVIGLAMMPAGYYMLKLGIGPMPIGATFLSVGGFLVAGDFVRAAIPAAKDVVDFVEYAIRKIRGAFKNGA